MHFTPRIAPITRAVENLEARALRTIHDARIAKLNWKFEVLPRLTKEIEPLLARPHRGSHYFSCEKMPTATSCHVFTILAHSNFLYPPQKSDTIADSDSAATLTYNFHVNGSIVVTLSPHVSSWSKVGRTAQFTLDYYASPQLLSGPGGSQLIRRHLRTLLDVARYSQAHCLPSPASGKLIAKLERSTARYTRMNRTFDEALRTERDAELALGTALIGGLIASTLLPLSQIYGKEKRDLVEQIRTQCKARLEAKEVTTIQACMEGHPEFDAADTFGTWLPTGGIIMAALMLTMIFTLLVKNLRNK